MNVAPGRVLVVDDEPYVRDVLREILTTMGHEVLTASTGAQALEAVPTFQPHVILVDLLMPGLLGTDVLKALRGAGVTVPVILLSGLQIEPTALEGFFGVLPKPFDLRMLAELVMSAVAAHRRPEPA